MDAEQLRHLPSTFYRVAVKALIFNPEGRLLIATNDEGLSEIPGGGWEHGESLHEAVQRELQEELGVAAKTISDVKLVFPARSERGWATMRVVVRVETESYDFVLNDPDVVAVRYVTKDEFKGLRFAPSDGTFPDYADEIWSHH